MNRLVTLLSLAALVLVASCNRPAAQSSVTAAKSENATPQQVTTHPNDYSKATSWLCLPGRDDDCNVDLTTTVISPDGHMSMEPWAAATDPKVDCFYVYPTVSTDKSGNSDMIPGQGEINVVKAQFARFAEVCRPYAPLYRQVTLTALRSYMTGGHGVSGNPKLAYDDVKDAWNYYLQHYNDGRGVVLIGHSQGSGILMALLKNEIDGKPIQEKLVSAILAGARLPVPEGKLVGGVFQHIPLCTGVSETGCVITFASFRSNRPPPPNAFFGKVKESGMMAGCTNPAALGGGSGPLHAYLPAKGIGMSSEPQQQWVASNKAVTTPFVSLPGMLTAQCVNDANGSYLAVTVHGDPTDPRVDDISGDVVINGEVQPQWGLHLIDMNLAMGNLLDIVSAEADAYTGSGTSK